MNQKFTVECGALPGFHFAWAPAQATIRARALGLALAGATANERRSRDQVYLLSASAACWRRYPGDLNFRPRLLVRMRLEICAQRANDRAGRLATRRPLCVHRQAGHVGAEEAGVLSLEHDRIVHRHHSTPASLRMRFPSWPASCPCIVTQISLPLSGWANST